MDCQNFKNLISSYIDNELSNSQRRQFEEHISHCTDCRNLYEEICYTDSFIKESKSPLPDEDYWSSFDARLNGRIKSINNKIPWWKAIFKFIKPVSWVAIAFLLIIGFMTPEVREHLIKNNYNTTSKAIKRPEPKQKITPNDSKSTKSGASLRNYTPKKSNISFSKDSSLDTTSKRGKPLLGLRNASSRKRRYIPSSTLSTSKKDTNAKEKSPPICSMPSSFKENKDKKDYASEDSSCSYVKSENKGFKSIPSLSLAPQALEEHARERKIKNHDKVELPIKPDGFIEVGEFNYPAKKSKKYLARSEVLLLRIVNFSDGNKELSMLKGDLKRSNYIEDLEKSKSSFIKNPQLEKHTRDMKVITKKLMKTNPENIDDIKKIVIESGILERTRVMKL